MAAIWCRRPLVIAAAFVVILTLWRLSALATGNLELFFDEAQYWFWSLDPDFGYFSKPPMVAWLIGLGTAVFGHTEFAVRMTSPLCYAITAALVAGIAWSVFADAPYRRTAAAWAAITVATLPAVSLSAQLASTDVPLLMFWAAALLCLVQYWRKGGWWWIGFGVALGGGLMSKYAMIYLLLCLTVALVLVPETRSLMRTKGLWFGIALGALLFAPNLWWNWTHQLASFNHTAANAHWDGQLFKPSKLAEFAGAQFGIMGPVLLAAFGWAALTWRRLTPGERLLMAFSLPVLVLMLGQALLSRAHANCCYLHRCNRRSGRLAVAASAGTLARSVVGAARFGGNRHTVWRGGGAIGRPGPMAPHARMAGDGRGSRCQVGGTPQFPVDGQRPVRHGRHAVLRTAQPSGLGQAWQQRCRRRPL